MTEHRETEFIPTDWVERAITQPGLQVYSRPVRVPVSVPQRRKNDPGVPTLTVDEIEGLLWAAFTPVGALNLAFHRECLTLVCGTRPLTVPSGALLPEKPLFQSVDLDHLEELLAAYED